MFRFLTLFWSLFLLSTAGWTAWHLTRVGDADRQQLTRLTDRMPLPQAERPHTGLYSQQREGVRRDLWTPKDGVRLQTVQWSASANLAASQREHALLEELAGVRCYVQESVDPTENKQRVCVLTATHATYDYHALSLDAQPVSLERYVLPELHLPDRIADETPVMVGKARHAEFQNLLELKGAVTVVALQGMELRCDQAKLDREIGYGKFEALSEDTYTLIQGKWRQGIDGEIPLMLRSRCVEVWMANSRAVRDLIAEGDARMGYGGDWSASGDRVLYHRHANSSDQDADEASLDGLFQLVADRPQGCSIQHLGGSEIAADRITLNSATQELTLYNADGRLHTERGELEFQADKALWGQGSQCLALTGNVVISQGGRHLRAFGDVVIAFDSIVDGVKVSHVECVGPTEMAMGGEGNRLRCQGVTTVDLQQQRMTLVSPRDGLGKVRPEDQLVYQGSEGELTSDQLAIDYILSAGEVIPKYFAAQGHVCLARKSQAGGVQYALADALDYSPESGAMRFRAIAPRRVVFFDRQYDLKVSAPEVQITRDARTGQEKVKGLGDLRMTLLDQELAHLRKRFAIEGNKKS